MSTKITLTGISKEYATLHGPLLALTGIDLTIEPGEFLSIVGPSGCGKSTLLRLLAGINTPSMGAISFQQLGQTTNNDQLLNRNGAATVRPRTAMVFQEYALFPWRTVIDNVAFGLEVRNIPRQERLAVAQEYLNKVGLARFADAWPHQLSGGMQQRVAIARALANDPAVLLMDEPLGALDAQTRNLLQEELLRIWEAERKTVIYITHAIEEAVMLGDRVVLMTARPGRIKQIYPIPLPRPRALTMRTTVAFNELVQWIWEELVGEVNQARAEEMGALSAVRGV